MDIDNAHTFLIRISTADGILVGEDTDFAEDARWDWFDQTINFATPGEVIQLIDRANGTADGVVIAEEIKE